MKLKIKGKTYRYSRTYFKHEDKFEVQPPKYSVSRQGEVYHENGWKKCHFYLVMIGSNPVMYVSPSRVKDGVSELGPVDDQGFVDIHYLSRYVVRKINIYDSLYDITIWFRTQYDKAIINRRSRKYIIWAAIISLVYFSINHFFDGWLQNLINNSNLIQSIIIILSLATLINIFHPFALRNEVTIEEVDELIQKRQKHLVKNFEDYKRKWGKTRGYH